MHKVFGIRHHGPGSARQLLKALMHFLPDCILIEGPSEASHLIDFVGKAEIIPPAAILGYQVGSNMAGSIYPFASFSPEWQAMQYGTRHSCPTRFIDLSHTIIDAIDNVSQDTAPDPMTTLAKRMGYSDTERWWEVTFERNTKGEDVFDLIIELMEALRWEKGTISTSNLVREAYMRKQIRTSLKAYERVAIVCGAWHAPALSKLSSYTAKEDNSILKPYKAKSKLSYTWIPWSHRRLSRISGYGAGIDNPPWYQYLFEDPQTASIKWLSYVGRSLGVTKQIASAAHLIAAQSLAHNLAYIRQLPLPGMPELLDGLRSVYFDGHKTEDFADFRAVQQGFKVGEIHSKELELPLQLDFFAQLRKLRLSKLWGDEHPTEKQLDLRKPNQLASSVLWHRLLILNVHWALPQEIDFNPLGNFHEFWRLQWYPECSVELIDAGLYGTTVETACIEKITQGLPATNDIKMLSGWMRQCLQADLSSLVVPIAERILKISYAAMDAWELIESIPDLIYTLRYGDLRQNETDKIEVILAYLLPRICIQLPQQIKGIDYDAAQSMRPFIRQLDRALQLLNHETHMKNWVDSLQTIETDPTMPPLIRAQGLQMLLQKEVYSVEEASDKLGLELSRLQEVEHCAGYLEGLLGNNADILIKHPSMRSALSQWFTTFNPRMFVHYLPLFRRVFADYSPSERDAILRKVQGSDSNSMRSPEIDTDLYQTLQPLFKKLSIDSE